jgi:type VI secretion system protein VasJ
MADLDDPRLGLGTEPVPGEEAAGVNVRDDAAFETLSDEVSKMDVDGPNAVDWRKVMESSEALLRDRTKDFLIAGYYAYALGREEGLRGLAVGLGVISGIVETYWDTGFPPPRRERARVGAVNWLAERFGPTLEDLQINSGNARDLLATLEMVERLDTLLDEKTEKTQANLGDLLRPLRAKRQEAQYVIDQHGGGTVDADKDRASAPEVATAADAASTLASTPAATPASSPPSEGGAEEAPVPAVAAVVPPPQASASAPPAAAVPQIPSKAGPEFERAVNAFRSSALGFARGMRVATPLDPRAFVLHRAALWLPVVDLPPDTDGVTMLPPPAADVIATISSLLSAGNHSQIVVTCETATEDRLFWLDPHRHVANALGALGQGVAQAAVISGLASFLGRFPGLVDLKFEGGTPFADDQTRLWLSETVLKSGETAGGGGDAADDTGADTALSVARGLVANGKQGEAVKVLSVGGRTAVGARARLIWDLAKADLCLSMGMADTAYSLLTALDERHKSFDLEDWEPSLAERLCVLRLQSLRRGGVDELLAKEQVKQLTIDLVARLYRLNAAAALNVMRG